MAASQKPPSDKDNAPEDEKPMRSFVEESQELAQLIAQIVSCRGAADASVFKRAQDIFDKYQEQPQLLDPLLEATLNPLTDLLRDQALSADSADLPTVKRICRLIHTISTVRGPKTVAQFFPHAPGDLEPALALLGKCHLQMGSESILKEESSGGWEACCVVLLWLSILALIPFDLASVDTALTNPEAAEEALGFQEGPPLVQRLVGLCWGYLASPAAVRDTAALLLSRLLTRPDMEGPLHSFVQKACGVTGEALREGPAASVGQLDFLLPGLVATLAAVYKVGGRDILLKEAATVWTTVALPLGGSQLAARSPLVRRLRIKLVQRVGLAELPPRVASWRYQRGNRSLTQNLTRSMRSLQPPLAGDKLPSRLPDGGRTAVTQGGGEVVQVERGAWVETEVAEEGDEEEMDVPEVVEEVIEELLGGLRDKDTGVRWSAAKGLGRLTSRLPLGMADEVVEALLGLFTPAEGDGAWHGGCLALAELARRGLLLPHRLPSVLPLVAQALHFDVQRGAHSVGAHVRDAAAYVCWAFARAYAPAVMEAPLRQLAPALLTVACYDREVNCRRAAAAAFQEGVGRQGNFPHGIDIVTAADFAALGPLGHAYRSVALQVARFGEYRRPLMEELLNVKIRHWSRALRELAAEALALLVPLEPLLFAGAVVDQLLPATCAPELPVRHGATLALAAVLAALHQHGAVLSPDRQVAVAGVISGIEAARLYRGKGGEMMRVAACRLVHSIALAALPLAAANQTALLASLEDHLAQPTDEVQVAAAEAFGRFAQSYALPATSDTIARFTTRHVALLQSSPVAAVRRGAALALGALPRELLRPAWPSVLSALCSAATLLSVPENDVETRVNAVKSLSACCATLGVVAASRDTSARAVAANPGKPHQQEAEAAQQWIGEEQEECPRPGPDEKGGESGERRVPSGGPEAELVSHEGMEESGVGRGGLGVPAPVMGSLVGESLLLALEDYTTDNRGDVGSLVREAAMESLCTCTCLLARADHGGLDGAGEIGTSRANDQMPSGSDLREHTREGRGLADEGEGKGRVHERGGGEGSVGLPHGKPVLDERLAGRVVAGLAKQALEKIDRTRGVAGRALQALLWARGPQGRVLLASVPHRAQLERLVPEKASLNWADPGESYPRLVPLLAYEEYRAAVLAGLVVAVGGLAESLSKSAATSLLHFLTTPTARPALTHSATASSVFVRPEEGTTVGQEAEGVRAGGAEDQSDGMVRAFGSAMLALLRQHAHVDRVIIPALKTLDVLLASSALSAVQVPRESFGPEAVQLLARELRAPPCRDIPKLLTAVNLWCHFLAWPAPASQGALQQLLALLQNRYPKVRQYCAEQLYLQLLTIGEGGAEESNGGSEGFDFRGGLEEALELLSETNWGRPLKEAEEPRRRVRELLGSPKVT